MSVYLMVGLNITDPETYAQYVEHALPTLEQHGAEALVVSDSPVSHEGDSPFGRYVVLRFEDQQAFEAWYRSPEYQAAIPLRHKASEAGFFVTVDGPS